MTTVLADTWRLEAMSTTKSQKEAEGTGEDGSETEEDEGRVSSQHHPGKHTKTVQPHRQLQCTQGTDEATLKLVDTRLTYNDSSQSSP